MPTYTYQTLIEEYAISPRSVKLIVKRLIERGLASTHTNVAGEVQIVIENESCLSKYAKQSMSMSPPSSAAVKAFLEHHNLTGEVAAKLAYLSGSNAIRHYTNSNHPTSMSLSMWFTLHAKVMLDACTIARIESAMDADADK